MEPGKLAERFSRQQRRIANQHDYGGARVLFEFRSRRHHSISRAALLALDYESKLRPGKGLLNFVGFMPNHHPYTLRAALERSFDYIFSEQSPRQAVQHLGVSRLEACGLACGENERRKPETVWRMLGRHGIPHYY